MSCSVPLLALALFPLARAGNAQALLATNIETRPCEVFGQVAGVGGLLQDGLDVELIPRDKAAKQRVHASMNGNFDFRSVPAGEYQFRVLNRSGLVIHKQTEMLTGKQDFVFLFVQDPKSTPSTNNTVSFSALQHRVPDRARDALRASQKAAAADDLQSCIQHLQEALQIDPSFAEAHSDLAARYMKMGRIEEALQHARAAFDLNPGLAQAGCNFAVLLVSLKKYREAESVAREILKSTSSYLPELQGILAISLIGQNRNLDEAFALLRRAATEIPFVMLFAARALVEVGKPELALDQVKTYLNFYAHDCERHDLETWVSSVQSRLTAKK